MAKFDKKVRSWSLKPETGFYLCPFRQSWSNTKQRKIKLDRKIILLPIDKVVTNLNIHLGSLKDKFLRLMVSIGVKLQVSMSLEKLKSKLPTEIT